MNWRHLLIFAFVFTIEVKVKAADIVALPNTTQLTQEPNECWAQVGKISSTAPSMCALRTPAGEKFRFQLGKSQITMDDETSLLWQESGEITLLAGVVWVVAKDSVNLKTEYGLAQMTDGEFIISREPRSMWISAVDGALTLVPRKAKSGIRLEAGEENWLGPVDRAGVGTSGIPRAIFVPDLIQKWARLFPGTRQEFEEKVSEFHKNWSRHLASIATYHQDLAERRRQEIADEIATNKRMRAQQEARERDMRALFRKKILID